MLSVTSENFTRQSHTGADPGFVKEGCFKQGARLARPTASIQLFHGMQCSDTYMTMLTVHAQTILYLVAVQTVLALELIHRVFNHSFTLVHSGYSSTMSMSSAHVDLGYNVIESSIVVHVHAQLPVDDH